MPVKEVPVPTGEEVQEAQEPQEVQPEEVLVEELPELIPQPKPIKTKQKQTKTRGTDSIILPHKMIHCITAISS